MNFCGIFKAKEILVETGWCDYVFTDTYQPMTILQKEAYYKQYKHLPNVPTAKEVEENGVDVGEALIGILQNVEENRLDITQLYREACSFLATTQKRTKKSLRRMKSFLENYAPLQPQKNSSFQSSNSFCAQCPHGVLVFYDRFHMRGTLSLLFFRDAP